MSIETPRLILRRPRLADVPALFEFLGDAEAMRHTHAHASLRECRRWVAVHDWHRRKNGYAPWTITTKVDDRIIGWGGLYDDSLHPSRGVELGYFLHPSAWRQGYASEMVAASMAAADRTPRLAEVRAFAHPENAGSRRVLEKLASRSCDSCPSWSASFTGARVKFRTWPPNTVIYRRRRRQPPLPRTA